MGTTRNRQLLSLGLAMLILLAPACGATGPEAIVKAAFEKWTQDVGVPYKNVSYQVLKNDSTFATVRVLATLRQSSMQDWLDQQADIDCRYIGSQWQCGSNFVFALTEAEQTRQAQQVSGTATAAAGIMQATATEYARQAQATSQALMATQAVVQQNADATATTAAIVVQATATEYARQAQATSQALMATQEVANLNAGATATALALGATATALALANTHDPALLITEHFKQSGYQFIWPGDNGTTGTSKVTEVRVDGSTVILRNDWRDGEFRGILQGYTLSGKWVQSNARGDFELVFTPDFASATGWWSYEGSSTRYPQSLVLLKPNGVVVFAEEFDKPSLDESRWVVTGSPVEIEGGVVTLKSNLAVCPYVYAKQNPFPVQGNFVLEVAFRYLSLTGRGVGLLAGRVAPAPGTELHDNDAINGFLTIFQDSGYWPLVVYFQGNRVFASSGPDLTQHTVQLRYSNEKYDVLLDGNLLYTSPPTKTRPSALWFGNPTNVGSNSEWTSLSIDYIRIESTP